MAKKFYRQLASRASAHVIKGDSLESLVADFDTRLEAVYGKPHAAWHPLTLRCVQQGGCPAESRAAWKRSPSRDFI